jgi:tRNA(fMet)-specific endonuclease VapC
VNGVILDTDVFSILSDGRPEADKFATCLYGVRTMLAFPSVAEVTHGAHLARWGSRRMRRLEEAIASNVLLLPTMGLLHLCGQLRTKAVRRGHPLGHPLHANDLWITACAAFYGVPLLTNNRRHFEGMPGVEVRSAP